MTDVHTKAQRSKNMAAIRSKDTKPELLVRSLLHSLGYRFRLHRADLPGKPDIVLPRLRVVIFVHGCFWHMHNCRFGKVVPRTNAEFWQAKRVSNAERDKRQRAKLHKEWVVFTIWECQTINIGKLEQRIVAFLRRYEEFANGRQ